MQLLITPLAALDLEEIGDHIAQGNPTRAGSFVAELRAHCEQICLNPAGYRRPVLPSIKKAIFGSHAMIKQSPTSDGQFPHWQAAL